MSNYSVYTETELLTKIKEIDLLLDESVEESEIDSTQNRSTFEVDVVQLSKQRDYYMAQLQQIRLQANKAGLVTLIRSPYRRGGC